MKEISEYLTENHFNSVSEAVRQLDEMLTGMEREVASHLIVDFPHKLLFEEIAQGLLESLRSEVVQVNSISPTSQITVAMAPPELKTTIALEDSLCVITVGSGEPLVVSDIANDAMLNDHPARGVWGSWASAPIVITGLYAGSVCALEKNARAWTDKDQELLQTTAHRISTEIENWVNGEVTR